MNKRQFKGISRRLTKIMFYLMDSEIKSKKYKDLIQKEINKIDKIFGDFK